MTLPESIWVALVVFAGVIVVLICLSVLIRLFSLSIGLFHRKKSTEPITEPTVASVHNPYKEDEFSSGDMILKDVDEPLAAMIIAIVSDESGIPLSELQVKSIKLLRRDQ